MRTRFPAVVALALACVAQGAAVEDPFVGTWKLNLTKSMYNPGPPPRSLTCRYEIQGNTLKNVTNTVNAEGNANNDEVTWVFDGRDYSVSGDRDGYAYRVTRVDAYTMILVVKKGGREVGTWLSEVSRDGKTLTNTIKRGEQVTRTEVFDRQ